MNKNTLYITFDGLSDPLGQSQIVPYLSGLAANGFHIHILSCEKKTRLEKEKETILTLIGTLPITWTYILYDEDAGTLSRLLYVLKIRALAKKVCSKNKMALVHCRSYLASLVGLYLKQKYSIPFIFDMRGFWANERIDGGIWKRSNPLQNFFYTYFKKKEKQFIEQADAIVSLTNAGVTEMCKHFSEAVVLNKVSVIPCCTNTSLFNQDTLKTKVQLPSLNASDHLLIYTGSIGTWYYTTEMIDCVLEWKKQLPTLRLLILTKDTETLTELLQRYTAEQRAVVITASASHKDVAGYLSHAKAAIFFIKPAYSKIASSPTKMAECWAMDLPIITNAGIGDNDLYFNTHKGGVLINDFTRSEYQLACSKYQALKHDKGFYREIALRFFDNKMAVQKYLAVYKSLSKV